MLCLIAAFLVPTALRAQGENRIYIEEHSVDPGQTDVSVPILLDSDQPLYGFSLSIVTDPSKLQLKEISLDGSVAAGADFNGGLPLEGGARLSWGVILDVTEPFDVNDVIEPGSGLVLANVVFDVDAGATGTAILAFEDYAADFTAIPPDPGAKTKLTLENGAPLEHTRSNGTIRIGGGGGARFIRGDTDALGGIELTDAVYLLNFLFLGGPEPPCRAAANVDDENQLELTDAVYLLNFLFLGGPEPPGPYPDCGEAGPQADCAESTAACS